MKTNLLILDSYKNIENLIYYSFSLSNRVNRKLKIVYVFDFNWMRQSTMVGTTGIAPSNVVVAERNINKEFDVADSKIRGIVTEYIKNHSGHTSFEMDVTQNNRISVVRNELEKDPDLIVLLSNHQSYSEITDGLVSYPKLMELVKCPVLIIPDKLRHATLENVVYFADYNPQDIQSIKHLADFMKHHENLHLTIFHNIHHHNFQEELKWAGFKNIVESELSFKNLEFLLKIKKDFLTSMEELLAEIDPDLIAILNEEKGFFEEIFTTNKTKNILTHFEKPLLVYHEKQKS